MRSSYEVRAQKFIREIFPFIKNCSDLDEYEFGIYDYQIEHPRRNIICDHGMTRVVFITSDYVVKIDYSEKDVARFGGGEKEVAFYEMAQREGMAYLFAKISRYEYEGRTFYIMPRVNGVSDDRFEDAWWFMTDKENEWCNDHGLYDLHGKNYGLVKGKVVIIDYGCYDEEQTSVYSFGPARRL